MSLDNYFRLIKSMKNAKLIKPIKRIEESFSDTDDQGSSDKKNFNELFKQYVDDDSFTEEDPI